MAKKEKRAKPGYVYILGNTLYDDNIKIGSSINPQQRIKSLNGQTARVGDFYLVWSAYIAEDCESVERALHYKFSQFQLDRENFRVDKGLAKKECGKFVKLILPIKNKDSRILKSISKKQVKTKTNNEKKSLWKDISKSNKHDFIRAAIALCMKEEKFGQPQYRRVSAIRSDGFTGIGRADLYVLSEHLRIVLTTQKLFTAKKLLREKVGNGVKITNWKGGLSFFISNQKEFAAFKKWFNLGQKN